MTHSYSRDRHDIVSCRNIATEARVRGHRDMPPFFRANNCSNCYVSSAHKIILAQCEILRLYCRSIQCGACLNGLLAGCFRGLLPIMVVAESAAFCVGQFWREADTVAAKTTFALIIRPMH